MKILSYSWLNLIYSIRIQNKFGDQYKLFLLVNPEDDKPVAVVVPRKTLQPETTGDCLALRK